jgi:hypothetical protein
VAGIDHLRGVWLVTQVDFDEGQHALRLLFFCTTWNQGPRADVAGLGGFYQLALAGSAGAAFEAVLDVRWPKTMSRHSCKPRQNNRILGSAL